MWSLFPVRAKIKRKRLPICLIHNIDSVAAYNIDCNTQYSILPTCLLPSIMTSYQPPFLSRFLKMG